MLSRERKRPPFFLMAISLLLIWWLITSIVDSFGPTYADELASFEAKYGVDSSQIAGCWDERGGEWVNTCEARAENSVNTDWIFPAMLLLVAGPTTIGAYVDYRKFTKTSESDEPSDQE